VPWPWSLPPIAVLFDLSANSDTTTTNRIVPLPPSSAGEGASRRPSDGRRLSCDLAPSVLPWAENLRSPADAQNASRRLRFAGNHSASLFRRLRRHVVGRLARRPREESPLGSLADHSPSRRGRCCHSCGTHHPPDPTTRASSPVRKAVATVAACRTSKAFPAAGPSGSWGRRKAAAQDCAPVRAGTRSRVAVRGCRGDCGPGSAPTAGFSSPRGIDTPRVPAFENCLGRRNASSSVGRAGGVHKGSCFVSIAVHQRGELGHATRKCSSSDSAHPLCPLHIGDSSDAR